MDASTKSFFVELYAGLYAEFGNGILNAMSTYNGDPETLKLLGDLVQNLDDPDKVGSVYIQFYQAAQSRQGWLSRVRNKAPNGLPRVIVATGTYMQAHLLVNKVEEFQFGNKDVNQAIRALLFNVSIWDRQGRDPDYPTVFPDDRQGQEIEHFEESNTYAPRPLATEWANPTVIALASAVLNHIKQKYCDARAQ